MLDILGGFLSITDICKPLGKPNFALPNMFALLLYRKGFQRAMRLSSRKGFFAKVSYKGRPMGFHNWLGNKFLKRRSLYYKLNLIFGLFFLFPILGFIFFSIKYDMLNDEYLPFFFLGILFFSFISFNILKNIFDKISSI